MPGVIKVTTDPLDYHTIPPTSQRTVLDIAQECGIIINWCINRDPGDSFHETLDKRYRYGMYEMKGGTISEEGVHSYPEDPDLYPLCEVRQDDEVVWVYEYGIVCIKNLITDKTFVCRMD